MAKMKRSEFKKIVKECVRECMREIMQEQLNPIGFPMQERALPAVAQQMPLINPFDDYQMRLRQELISQQGARGAMQQQLQRQSALMNPLQNQVSSLSELAGIGPSEQSPQRYNSEAGTGYMNPTDRLKLAAQNNSPYRYDPSLDAPPAGSQRQQAQQQQQRILRMDPALDTPLGGGDMRMPDKDIMKHIFEDTAQNTYRAQSAAEGMGVPADKYAEIVSRAAPEDLFAGSQNWSALAFK